MAGCFFRGINRPARLSRLLSKGLIALLLWITATAATADRLRVVVISDMNSSYGSVTYEKRVSTAVRRAIELKADLVISTGDMVAGQRTPVLSDARVRAMWKAFHDTVSDPLARAGIPFAVTPGNHDASAYATFQHERRIYRTEWKARKPRVKFVDDTDYPFFYAFDLGGVRFVSLDATTVGALSQPQMKKLERVMSSGPQTRIAFSHLPLWPFAKGRESEIIGDPALAALFQRTGIDMHLSGHHHAYYPGAADGVALISQACVGAGPRPLIGQTRRSDAALTVLDIDNGKITVSAYKGDDFRAPIAPDSLPAALHTARKRIDRLDRARLPGISLKSTR